MVRRSRAPARPRLPRHAIAWFPPPALLAAVEAFRAVHDPLAGVVPAHVTLVFPFASSLTALQLLSHMRRQGRGWPALPVTLAGCDAFGLEWVHLRVMRGHASLCELHDRLHRGALAPFRHRVLAYEPHLTIGRAADDARCASMLAEARQRLHTPINATVERLTLVRVHSPTSVESCGEIALGAA